MNYRSLTGAVFFALAAAAFSIFLVGCSGDEPGGESASTGRAWKASPQMDSLSDSVGGQHSPRRTIPLYDPPRNPPHPAEESQDSTLRLASFDIQPGEELWVIVEPERRAAPNENLPGCGALMATLPGRDGRVAVPLKHTDVKGDIQGYIATVDVTQQFHNPYNEKIEAVYVFPLPQNAAVNDFVMTVGERKIRGVIRKREVAEQIYANARRQGHVASLLTQERPNVFTQKVANIEPGHQIDINIQYLHTLAYDDGWYEYVFPMVVGPRFNPPYTSQGVGAVARGTEGRSGQATEVSYLGANERSGHDISVALTLNANVPIEDVKSINHRIKTKTPSPEQMQVQLDQCDSMPNEDFVLRFRVAGEQLRTVLNTHSDDNGNYFTLVAYPPAQMSDRLRSPMEMIFVLDCSGSMNGAPIQQAKQATICALNALRPDDTFQIIRFSNNASQLGAEPLPATAATVQSGIQYLNSLKGTGGTEMLEGMCAALDFPHDESRLRLVSFMTDGFIGNETNVLAAVHEKVGAARIFSFGVGQAPNRFLMDRMARIGRGAVAYLSLEDDAADIMSRFTERISHPAMTDISIDWGGAKVTDVYPRRLPDLFVGRQLVLTGRYEGDLSTVKLKGLVGDRENQTFSVAMGFDESSQSKHNGLPAVWARMKIADLMNGSSTDEPFHADDLRQSVTQVALNHNLVSSYTSMIAVDSMTRTSGNRGTTVAVPVPVPAGTKYETELTN